MCKTRARKREICKPSASQAEFSPIHASNILNHAYCAHMQVAQLLAPWLMRELESVSATQFLLLSEVRQQVRAHMQKPCTTEISLYD